MPLSIDAGIPPQSGAGIAISTQRLYHSGIPFGILRLQSARKVHMANECPGRCIRSINSSKQSVL